MENGIILKFSFRTIEKKVYFKIILLREKGKYIITIIRDL